MLFDLTPHSLHLTGVRRSTRLLYWVLRRRGQPALASAMEALLHDLDASAQKHIQVPFSPILTIIV